MQLCHMNEVMRVEAVIACSQGCSSIFRCSAKEIIKAMRLTIDPYQPQLYVVRPDVDVPIEYSAPQTT